MNDEALRGRLRNALAIHCRPRSTRAGVINAAVTATIGRNRGAPAAEVTRITLLAEQELIILVTTGRLLCEAGRYTQGAAL